MTKRPPGAQRPPSSGVPVGMRPPSRTRPDGATPSRGVTQIVNRPLSKTGLPSAHTQSGGRQVADKSFFIGILRSKINQLVAELERLRTEIENRKRGKSIQTGLNQQVTEARAQLAQKEAEMADYNVLADRVQANTQADQMQASFEELEKGNNQREQEVNRLFREKRELDSIVFDQERQVQEMMRGSGSPALQEMGKEIESLESQCSQLRNQNGDLQGKSREQLLAMVKDATQKIGTADRQIQDEQKTLNYVQSQIKLLEEREGDLQSERGQKYLKLLQREKEMTAFLQNFPQAVETAKTDLAHCQRRVFDLLAQTARDLESVNELPSVDNMKKLETDLELKRRQMQDAQSTAQKLRAEVEQRRQEFENLQTVDVKIADEIEATRRQMKEWEAELPNYTDVETLREEGETRKRGLAAEKERLKAELGLIKKAANAVATRYNEARAAIRANDVQVKLHELERDIRAKATESFQMVETIEDNRRRTNYSLVKRHALTIVQEINTLLCMSTSRVDNLCDRMTDLNGWHRGSQKNARRIFVALKVSIA
jgi:intraflagellar transport protein 74